MAAYRFFMLLPALIWLNVLPVSAQTERLRDSLLALARMASADTTRVLALKEAGRLYLNSQPDTAFFYFERALDLALKSGFEKGAAQCRINMAYVCNDKGRYEQSKQLCSEAIILCRKLNLKKELAAAYNNLGGAWNSSGNPWMAIDSYEKSLDAMQDAEMPPLFPVAVRNNIAILYNDQGLYDKGLAYSLASLEQSEALGDALSAGLAAQNVANACKGLQRQEDALRYYRLAAERARMAEHQTLLATSLSNIAEILHRKGRQEEAKRLYAEGLGIAQANEEVAGQVFNLHGLSLIALDEKRWPAAQGYALEASKLADSIHFNSYAYAVNLTLSDLALARGDLRGYRAYREKYSAGRDTIAGKSLVQAIQGLEIKYETEKKEQQIRALQQEAELQRLRLQRKNGLAWGLGLLALFALLAGWLVWRNARHRKKLLEQELRIRQQTIQQLQQEQQLITTDALLRGQEEERGRLARDLHDGLGGMLSGIKHSLNSMKINPVLPATSADSLNRVIADMDRSISELRLIARNMMPEALVRFGLPDALQDFCDYLGQSAAMPVRFQAFGMSGRLDRQTEVILFRIAQELLNNVVKHSGATSALVQLLRDGNRLSLTVEDNGKGFDAGHVENASGLGWMNIRSRVSYLDGMLDLRTKPGQGTSVTVDLEVRSAD